MAATYTKTAALKAAFPCTIPIMTGFVFLGTAYGIYMRSLGFSAAYPCLMSLSIFAGSMEFAAATLLLGPFDPCQAFLLTLAVNARHLFYGISMLDKYKNTGLKKVYLIFGMCDESFSINHTVQVPKYIDAGWFMFFVTLLNQIYWVFGATLGGLCGALIPVNTKGLEFVMTALFIVIFIEQLSGGKKYFSAATGIGVSALSLAIFGRDTFIIPAMGGILLLLTLARKPIEKRASAQTPDSSSTTGAEA